MISSVAKPLAVALVSTLSFAQERPPAYASLAVEAIAPPARLVATAFTDSTSADSPATSTSELSRQHAASWNFAIAPLLWFASIDGDGGDGSAPPVDIAEDWSPFGSINGGFMLGFEARAPEDRFSLLADGLYLSLADEDGALRTDTNALMLEFGGGLPFDAAKNWEAIAGLRYVDLEFDSKVAGVSSSASQTWIDPWIGVRGEIPLGGRWGLGMRGDVGGFGVGTQFTWQGLAVVQAQLGSSVRFDVGYRAIALDFDDSELEYDALIHGPQIALAFRF